jgi:putative transposase
MSNHRKTWSQEQKLEILNHYKSHSLSVTSREFGVSTTSILNWEKKLNAVGQEGLLSNRKSSAELELQRLLRENRELKSMVAEKDLELRIKDALLKKNQFRN